MSDLWGVEHRRRNLISRYPFDDRATLETAGGLTFGADAILGADTKEQHQIVFGNVPPGGAPPDGAIAPSEAAAGNMQLLLAQQAGQPIEDFLSDTDGYGALPYDSSLRTGFGPKSKPKSNGYGGLFALGVIGILACAAAIFVFQSMQVHAVKNDLS